MLGFKLVPEVTLQLKEDRLADLQNLLSRMESEMHYWRERADGERERADRLNDSLLAQHGLPETTPTVIREKKLHKEEMQTQVDKQASELAEMFTDSLDASDDLNWVDPDLAEAAKGWMSQAKEAREAKV